MNLVSLICICLKAIWFISGASGAAVLTVLVLGIPQPQVYDFENLKMGKLERQDGWPDQKLNPREGDFQVLQGGGINQTRVLVRTGEGPDIIRKQDAQFHLKPINGSENDAMMQYDIRYGGPTYDAYSDTA